MIGVGCVGGAAIAWVAFKVSDAIETALDDAFGDVPFVPPEVQFGGRHDLPGGGAGERPTADAQGMYRTHSDGEF